RHPEVMKPANYLFVLTAAYLLVFRSPFRVKTSALILAGYYFVFEYAAFSRGYMLAVAIIFGICVLLRNQKVNPVAYYVLLFLLCNCHIAATFLVFGFQAFF